MSANVFVNVIKVLFKIYPNVVIHFVNKMGVPSPTFDSKIRVAPHLIPFRNGDQGVGKVGSGGLGAPGGQGDRAPRLVSSTTQGPRIV